MTPCRPFPARPGREIEERVKDIHDECGVFGIFGDKDAATLAYLGLHALQHRGQESAGIVTSDGETLHLYRQMGLVADVFTADVLKGLPGSSAIGHVRYSTAGSSTLQNAQPMRCTYEGGSIALAHNGNIVNFRRLREGLMRRGHVFQSSSDSEVLLHLVARRPAADGLEAVHPAAEGQGLDVGGIGLQDLVVDADGAVVLVEQGQGRRGVVAALDRLHGAAIFTLRIVPLHASGPAPVSSGRWICRSVRRSSHYSR